VIQIVVYLREGFDGKTREEIAADVTAAVRRFADETEPVEVWLREYGPGRVFLGGKEI
jgi:hypothetical protein